MARVRDLWHNAKPGPDGKKVKTKRHPDNGGDKNARRWLAIWLVNGRERAEAFRTEKAAKAYGTKMESDLARGEYIHPDAGKVTVGELAAKWLSLREVGPGTAERYESVYRLHVEPVFGNEPVGSVVASDVAAWSKSLAGQPGNRTLALIILTGVFDLALADKVRRDNPAKSEIVGRPKPARAQRDSWPAARVHAVADSVNAQWHDLPLTLAGLGLRQAEGFALALADFDTAAGVVHVVRQVSRRGTFKLPKGGKTRDVPLSRGVDALAGQAEAHPVTLPWENEDGSLGAPVTVDLLWAGPKGKPLEAWWWHREEWAPALKAVGVQAGRENGAHALRHFYSTALLDNGVSLAGVMDFMGHSRENAPLAVGVYGHVTPETFQAARDAVDRTLFRLRPVTSNGTLAELRPAR